MNKNSIAADSRMNDLVRARKERRILGYFTLFFLLLIVVQFLLVITQLLDWQNIYWVILFFVCAKLAARDYSTKDLYISVLERLSQDEEEIDS